MCLTSIPPFLVQFEVPPHDASAVFYGDIAMYTRHITSGAGDELQGIKRGIMEMVVLGSAQCLPLPLLPRPTSVGRGTS